jgi:ribosomal protein S18 acetylase RimI-like enzyme
MSSEFQEEISTAEARVVLRTEPWDRAQLQIKAAKIDVLEMRSAAGIAALHQAVAQARSLDIKHLACRIDTRARLAAVALQSCRFVLVDTVVHIALRATDFTATSDRSVPQTILRWADPKDATAIGALAKMVFSDPASSFNRYLNDGGFTRAQVERVYSVWGETSVGGAGADATLCAFQDETLVGFLTVKNPSADGTARVPLNAVAPHMRGQGLYSLLVATAAQRLFSQNAQSIEMTTQLQQLAVQKTWLHFGAQLVGSSYSFHQWI